MNDIEQQLEARKQQLAEKNRKRVEADALAAAEKAARDAQAAKDADEMATLVRQAAALKEALACGLQVTGIAGVALPPPPPPPPVEDDKKKGKNKRGRPGVSKASPSLILNYTFGNKIEATVFALGGALWEDADPKNPKYTMPLSVVPEGDVDTKHEDGFNLPMFTNQPGKFVYNALVTRTHRPEIFISEFETRMRLPYNWVAYLLHVFARMPENLRLVEKHKQWWIYTAYGLEILCRRDITHLRKLAVLYSGIINVEQDPNCLPVEEILKEAKFRTVEINKAYAVKLANEAVLSESGIRAACKALNKEQPMTAAQLAAQASMAQESMRAKIQRLKPFRAQI